MTTHYKKVQSAKYLGITIPENHKMYLGQRTSDISSKATKTLGLTSLEAICYFELLPKKAWPLHLKY